MATPQEALSFAPETNIANQGRPVTLKEGDIVRASGTKTQFVISPEGQLQGIRTPEELARLGGELGQELVIQEGQQFSISGLEGAFTVTPEGEFTSGVGPTRFPEPEPFKIELPETPTAEEVQKGAEIPEVKFPEQATQFLGEFEDLTQTIKEQPDVKALTTDKEAARSAITSRTAELEKLFAAGQIEKITRDAFAEFEIKKFQTDVAGLRDKLAKEEEAEVLEVDKASKLIASASFIRGNVGRIQRHFAITKAGISMRLQATAQNFEVARNLATQIVEAKVADLKDQRTFVSSMIELNRDLFNTLSTQERAAIGDRMAFITSRIDQERKKAEQIVELMIRAPGAEINPATDNFNTAASKAATWLVDEPKRKLEQLKAETDVDFINRLRLKYPDAGIEISDTPGSASRKVQSGSGIYREERSFARAKTASLSRGPSAPRATATERILADKQASLSTLSQLFDKQLSRQQAEGHAGSFIELGIWESARARYSQLYPGDITDFDQAFFNRLSTDDRARMELKFTGETPAEELEGRLQQSENENALLIEQMLGQGLEQSVIGLEEPGPGE